MENLKVKIKKLHPNAVIPTYAKPGDMGMDITAISIEYDEKIDCYVYHTGLAFEVPEGYGMFIFPRSSNRKTNSYLTNSVGVLDSGYRGELLLCFKHRNGKEVVSQCFGVVKMLENQANNKENETLLARSIIETNNKSLHDVNYAMAFAPYKVGDRICQIIIMPYPKVEFEEVKELSVTERGEGGFGSTDKK